MNPQRLASAILLAAAPAAAQSADWSSGPMMAMAQGLSVDAATVVPGANAGSMVITTSAFKATPPPPWTVPPMPGFPDLNLLPWVGIPGVDIDALSMGLDYILANPMGQIDVPMNHWGAITFSVTRGTTGAPGGLINGQILGPGGAAADIFGYILPGSVGFPSNWIDVPLRPQDGKEINLDAPGAPANIDAHDLYMGAFFGDDPDLAGMIPGFPAVTIFFSVTTASVPSVPPVWWGAAPPSGATVLRTTWNPASPVSWSTPSPAFAPPMFMPPFSTAVFGLSPAEDIDALAIDLVRGRVLFSTTVMPAFPHDPILYVELGMPGMNHVYRTQGNTPVSIRVGLPPGGIDDIDGICALDPGAGNQIRAEQLFCSLVGPPVFPAPAQLGVSVHRRRGSTGGQELVSYMTGWPTPNNPQPGIAFVGVSLGTPTGFSIPPVIIRPAPSNVPFQGQPEQYVIGIPSGLNLTGTPAFFVWATFDSTGLDVSLPVSIVL
jgi:hypothetical protein